MKQRGVVWVWGCGEHGQHGGGTQDGDALEPIRAQLFDSSSSSSPSSSSSSVSFVSVSCGGSHVAALSENGDVWQWGGAGLDKQQTCGAFKVPLPSPCCSVSCGSLSSIAAVSVKSKPSSTSSSSSSSSSPSVALFKWGVGNTATVHPSKVPLDPSITRLHCISSGALHDLVIASSPSSPSVSTPSKSNDRKEAAKKMRRRMVMSIGNNSNGQCGTGDKKDVGDNSQPHIISFINNDNSKPNETTSGGEDEESQGLRPICVSGGGKHSLCVMENGSVFVWGKPFSTTTTLMLVPTMIPTLMKVMKVVCGDKHSLLITEARTLLAFGDNNVGQLGTGDTVPRAVPCLVDFFVGRWRIEMVGAGGAYGQSHSVAVTTNGEVFSWGSSGHGQLGHGNNRDAKTLLPKQVESMVGKQVISVSCGWLNTAVVVLEDSSVVEPHEFFGMCGLFSLLPVDLLTSSILSQLDFVSLCRISQTNRAFNKLSNTEDMWHCVFDTASSQLSPAIRNIAQKAFSLSSSSTASTSSSSTSSNGVCWRERAKVACLLAQRHKFPHRAFGTVNQPPPSPSEQKSVAGQLLSWFFKKQPSMYPPGKICLLGLDAGGKTTMLYKMEKGNSDAIVTSIPTIGLNVETVTHGSSVITTWDVGGEDRIRAMWRHYLSGVNGFIWMVDSNDRERMSECKDHLDSLFSRFSVTADIPILILANKQDLPAAQSCVEVGDRLDVDNLPSKYWWVQPTCAVTGDGLFEGLMWLYSVLSSK